MFKQVKATVFRQNGASHTMGDEKADISLQVAQKGNLQALLAKASLVPGTPLFKAQSGFDPKRALEIEVPCEASDFLAVYQHKEWWIRPEVIDHCTDIPKRTQLLLWQDDQGYHVLVALCGDIYRSDMGPGEKGITFTVSSNQERRMALNTPVCVYGRGKEPYKLCEDAVLFGAALTGVAMPRNEKQYPAIFDYLGWCTWDAFYQQVNAQGIVEKMEELKEKQLPLGWVLIDDGWSLADYKNQRLKGLGTDEAKFPQGLSGVIGTLKKSYGVRSVGVWQALMGYWNGIEEGSQAEAECRELLLTLPDGRVVPDPDKAFAFWSKWHGELKNHGVDFVKIDEQSAPSLFFQSQKSYGEASRSTQDGIGGSIGLHFSGNGIHCMGMAPQEMWLRRSQALIRSSDDYVPGMEDGFNEHLKQNVYTAMLYAPLYWGDWDMFWTQEKNGVRHAMLRAVSGGPVYVSDKVGQTEVDVLLPLIESDGKLIRCDQVGRPTLDCLIQKDQEKPLKVFNTFKDSYLVAAFTNKAQEAAIKLSELPNATHKEYVCYDHQGQGQVLSFNEEYAFQMEADDGRMLLLVPKRQGVTPIGLGDKYLSVALIEGVYGTADRCIVTLKQGGSFVFHSDQALKRVLLMGEAVFARPLENGFYIVECSDFQRPMLEIICE